MGACASKPWEIDLRDICQGLRCFFACCKGQIVIHTTDVPEIEDIEENVKKRLMTPVLYGLILCFYMVQPVVERLLGLLNYLKVMRNCVPIHLRNSFGFMVFNNQIFLKLLKKFGPHINVNLLKVFQKT